MRPTLKITRQLDTRPEALEREMNRLVNGLYDHADQIAQNCEVAPDVAGIVTSGIVAASYDRLIRVAPATSSSVVVVHLPQPRTEDGGKIIRVARVGALGNVALKPIGGALLNGVPRLFMCQSPGLAEMRFDGQNFWSSYHGALAWGEGL